jgi:hypothetical protein
MNVVCVCAYEEVMSVMLIMQTCYGCSDFTYYCVDVDGTLHFDLILIIAVL